ncbi:saccharopine dehydrogenase [Streptosporangium sp. NPDC000396]|uniref:saccharopine dehydrogenase n=1 Tax=Streptosporangium sp. NPDC000396 TaxID=3366185 RepID=UPI003686A6D7
MNDALRYDAQGPVLLVGGYGTVGSELARLAASHWPLLLTGRSPERAADLSTDLGAEARRWDLADPAAFHADVRAVVSVVNDPDDRVLAAALRGGIPYVDVTRWTARLQRAVTLAAVLSPIAPVLLSSGWMGGVVPLVAGALADRLGGAHRVETAVRYDLNDRAGADSVDFMDRLDIPFEVIENGRRRMIDPLSGSHTVEIGADATRVARIDTPEQFTLPLTLGTTTAITRIGFSSSVSTGALIGLGRAGFFRRARGDRWRSMRRSLLYSPGTGGIARMRLDVTGPLGTATATVTDRAGQAHLTAVGALLGLRRVLGEDGAVAPVGVVFPEQTPLPSAVLPALAEAGVEVTVEPVTGRAAA